MFIRSFPATVFTSSAVLSDSGKPYGGIAGISEFSSLQARPRHPGQQSVRSEAILTNELVKHKPKFQLCLCLHHHPHPHDPDPSSCSSGSRGAIWCLQCRSTLLAGLAGPSFRLPSPPATDLTSFLHAKITRPFRRKTMLCPSIGQHPLPSENVCREYIELWLHSRIF